MTIEESFNRYYETAKQTGTDLINKDCFANFEKMTQDKQMDTIMKVAIIAAIAGIVSGLILGTGGIVSGLISSVFVAGLAGTYTFAYFSNNQHCRNFVEKGVDGVQKAKITLEENAGSFWKRFS